MLASAKTALVHSACVQVLDAARQMADVVAACEAAGDTEGGHASEAEVQPVLEACLQPILTACQRSAEALQPDAPTRHLPPFAARPPDGPALHVRFPAPAPEGGPCLQYVPEATARAALPTPHGVHRVDERARVDPAARPTYLLNCTCALLDVVQGHPCCAQGTAQLQAQQASLAQELQSAAVGQLLGNCGLGALAARIRSAWPPLQLRLHKQAASCCLASWTPGGAVWGRLRDSGCVPGADAAQRLTRVGACCRLYQRDQEGAQGTMAADPELGEQRLAAALKACFALITRPEALPEFQQLQARGLCEAAGRAACFDRRLRQQCAAASLRERRSRWSIWAGGSPMPAPSLGAAQVPRLRAATAEAVAQAVSAAYRDVYAVLASAHVGAADVEGSAAEALSQTPEHVDTILGLA